MSALRTFEEALQAFLDDRNGEHWPLTHFVVYALTTDPETMTLDEPEWIMPTGQRDSMSKMLLTEALDTLKAETAPAVSYVSWEAEDDDDDD